MQEKTTDSENEEKTTDSENEEKTTDSKNERSGIGKAGWVTIWACIIVMVVILIFAYSEQLPMLQGSTDQQNPFLFAFVGVILYSVSTARTRRTRLKSRYMPDYFFRGAQAFVYLYIIIAIMSQTEEGTYSFTNWTPNLIGLLVGMFILHVEKAMEGLGQRFEEVLVGLFSRSLTAKTLREKQLDRLRIVNKFKDMQIQSELLASQIDDAAQGDQLRRRLEEVNKILLDGDLDTVEEEVNRLAWQFEELKRAIREESLTVKEILGAER